MSPFKKQSSASRLSLLPPVNFDANATEIDRLARSYLQAMIRHIDETFKGEKELVALVRTCHVRTATSKHGVTQVTEIYNWWSYRPTIANLQGGARAWFLAHRRTGDQLKDFLRITAVSFELQRNRSPQFKEKYSPIPIWIARPAKRSHNDPAFVSILSSPKDLSQMDAGFLSGVREAMELPRDSFFGPNDQTSTWPQGKGFALAESVEFI